ncbi:tyramine receptor 1-like isoform X2 [Stylophora pistillata]|nr:tyramine receptor 1-like isoform X2 [Stylophora pistillata]
MTSPTPKLNNNGTAVEEKFDQKTILISITFLIIIILLALFGNVLVVIAFRVFQKLRNMTNYFIVSLAVADILVAGISMPVWGAYIITGPEWKFNNWVQQVWSCVDILCGVASILHLCFISLERYVCISSPLTYHNRMTTRKAVIAIFGIWLFSIFMAVLKLILWSVPPPFYEIAVSVSCFLIPLAIMLLCYMQIYRVAHHQIKKIILTVHGSPKRFLLSKELKAAKTVGAVIGAFVICWGPFFVLNLVYALCKSCLPIPKEAVLAAKWLHYVNSVLNPIIYACMNKDFRSAFKRLLAFSCFYIVPGIRRQEMVLERSIYSERTSLRSAKGNSVRGKNSLKENSSLRSHISHIEMNGYHSCDKPSYV